MILLGLFLLLVSSSSSLAAEPTIRGRPLVFESGNRRGLTQEGDASTLWYVKSGSVPPPGCVAHEAVAPGVYLAQGPNTGSWPRGRWTPEMKYNPEMRTSAPPKFALFGVQVRVVPAEAEFFEFDRCVTKPAGRLRFYVSCAENRLRDLAEDPRVLWISPIPQIKMHSYESRRLMLGVNSALNGSGTRVAVSDTGLDWKHCAFYEGSAPPLGSVSSSRAKVVGIVQSSGGDYVALTGAHGTATAGVAAGYACDDETGVAPQAKVWFLDASTNDNTVSIPSDLETLLVNSGATVHSASWGSYTGGEYDDMSSRIDAMQRAYPTRCQVQSAGNDGPDGVIGPNQKNGLVVAACLSRAEAYPSMSPIQRAQQPEMYSHESQISFSSKGPAADGRLIPQVCAPGFKVRVPYAVNPGTVSHADYGRASGTSFSAPAIAGMIANLQQKWKIAHADALPTCALLEATLMAHASKPKRVVEDVGGSLDVLTTDVDTITTLGTPILDFSRWTDVDGSSVTSTSRAALCFENLDTEPWVMVMRWTDVAAVEGSSAPLINDLDMVVIGATGEVRVVDDSINNFEIVQSWPAQHTRVVVSAFQGVSTFGSQPFALHIRGKTKQVDCASTVLPSEYANCTGGVVSVDSWRGTTSCDFQVCPSGSTCGADCARTCDLSRPCSPGGPNGGSGYYEGATCRPTSCPAYTYVTDTVCKCKMGTARPCDAEGQMAPCQSSGAFGTCTQSLAAGGGLASVVSSSAMVLRGGGAWGLVVAFAFMLFN